MKKISSMAAIAILACGLLAVMSSCSDKDDDKTTDNTENTQNTENTGNTQNSETVEEVTQTGWTADEVAQANTAASISSLTQMEKDVILYCNLARMDGAKFWETYGKDNARGNAEYINSLESDLQSVKGRKMLEPDNLLMKAAAYHAKDMSDNDFFDHASSDGTSFGDRVYGFYGTGHTIAENICAGSNTAISIVMNLLVDDGLESLGHRKNILNEKMVAIGIKSEPHKTWRVITVQDFGDKVVEKAE